MVAAIDAGSLSDVYTDGATSIRTPRRAADGKDADRLASKSARAASFCAGQLAERGGVRPDREGSRLAEWELINGGLAA